VTAPATSRGVALIHVMRRVRAELGQAHRYAHTLRVARLAAQLARAHGEDHERARLAGLYHDLARLLSAERLLSECAERSMPIDAFERANPVVLHARLGAELARETYGVDDAAILSAIRKHTVAAENMSRLDVILYLADGIEPGRDYPERAGFVRLALRDLDAAMAAVLGSTIAYLGHRSLDVAPQTWAAARRLGVAVASVSAHDLETSSQMHATPPPAADSPAKGSTLPDLLSTVLAAAEDKKGEDLTVLDLDGRTIVADTFVIVTGRSKIQTRSIADAITEAARTADFRVARTEGYVDGGWILIDLGSIVVHVFTPDQRQFYNLERLWGNRTEARAQSS
jgi:ribosome silencing factor RsfS/YbeB/iojap